MKTNVTEIAPHVYRISTFHPAFGIQFNQFLVKDDEPFLMHTGMRRMFDDTLAAVASIIAPSSLRWIGFSHFEPDECGALNQWLEIATQAQAVCSFVGVQVMMNDFADRPARALADGEGLDLGRHRLRFLATPHLPHGWDAGFFFEERDRTLFSSDLFFQPGDPDPLAPAAGVMQAARDSIVGGVGSPLANDLPYTPYTGRALRKLADLRPGTLAVMHGSSFKGDGGDAIVELAAVLEQTLAKPAAGA